MNIVIVNCFDTYEHRVDLLHDTLVEAGNKVRVLTSDFRHFEKLKRTDRKPDFKLFNAKPYKKNFSYQRLRSHSKLSKEVFDYLEKHSNSVDLVWVLVPPNSFVADAAKYKERHPKTKLIFDLIDLWPETMPIGKVKSYFPFSIWKNLRDNNIKSADVIVTECDLYQEQLSTVINGKKAKTLYLARPIQSYDPKLNLPNDKINLCYLGSINNIIDIDIIGKIISEFAKQKLVELHIVGDGERRDELINTATKAGATVTFHGKVYDRREKQRIFDSCHYGLNIMKESVCVGLTMKSMDYLEFGLPMINNIKGDTWNFINRYRFGVNIENSCTVVPREYSVEMRVRAREFFERNLSTDRFKDNLKNIMNGDID